MTQYLGQAILRNDCSSNTVESLLNILTTLSAILLLLMYVCMKLFHTKTAEWI